MTTITEIKKRLEAYMDENKSGIIEDIAAGDFIAHAPTDIAFLLERLEMCMRIAGLSEEEICGGDDETK